MSRTTIAVIWKQDQDHQNLPELGVQIGDISASELADLATDIVISSYQAQRLSPQQMTCAFASIFFGAGYKKTSIVPFNVAGGPPVGTEFVVEMWYSYESSMIYDKMISSPKIRLVASRPTAPDYAEYFSSNNRRGALSITIKSGLPCVTEHTGWIGSNEVVAALKARYGVATVKEQEDEQR